MSILRIIAFFAYLHESFAVLSWRTSRFPLESFGENCKRIVAQFIGQLFHQHIVVQVGNAVYCFSDAVRIEVCIERHAGFYIDGL